MFAVSYLFLCIVPQFDDTAECQWSKYTGKALKSFRAKQLNGLDCPSHLYNNNMDNME